MNSELEETATLADLGPVLILRGGEHVRLRSVDFPVALKALLPLVVDVLDPSELCERLMAPLTKGDNALTEMVDIDQILADEQAAANEQTRREIEEAGQHREMMERLQAEDVERNRSAGPRMARAWAIFNSKARQAHDHAKAQGIRLMQAHCASLQAESEQRAQQAATAAAESVRQEFIERRSRIEAAFHAGKEWRSI